MAHDIKSIFRKIMIPACLIMTVFLLTGWFRLHPPIEVSFRWPNLKKPTLVMQIKNKSKTEILTLRVAAYNAKEKKHAQYTFHAKPGKTYEIGFFEMYRWWKPGDEYTIQAKGYRFPISGTINNAMAKKLLKEILKEKFGF